MKKLALWNVAFFLCAVTSQVIAAVTIAEYRQYSDEQKLAYVQGSMETMIYFTSKEATWKRNCIRDAEAQSAAANDLNRDLESNPDLRAERSINPMATSTIDAVCRAWRKRHHWDE